MQEAKLQSQTNGPGTFQIPALPFPSYCNLGQASYEIFGDSEIIVRIYRSQSIPDNGPGHTVDTQE